MPTHGTPSWSIPAIRATTTQAHPSPQLGELRRMLFELRNLLENSGDRQAALDVVDGIEELMAQPIRQLVSHDTRSEGRTHIELKSLIDAAENTVSSAIERAGVVVLRRGIRKAEVFVELKSTAKLVEDILRFAVDSW